MWCVHPDPLSLSPSNRTQSVLTIGFGDFAPQTDAGRGFLLIFQLVGVIFLGLVISSIAKFASNIGADRIIKHYRVHARASTVGHAVTSERKLRERMGLPPRANGVPADGQHLSNAQDGRLERTVTFVEGKSAGVHEVVQVEDEGGSHLSPPPAEGKRRNSALRPCETAAEKRKRRRQKLLLLRRERDKFDAMRKIQKKVRRWKQYAPSPPPLPISKLTPPPPRRYRALLLSLLAFLLLWTLGALLFLLAERHLSPPLSFFESLYFTFGALLTIGYGDFAPKSSPGKPLFILWSLLSIPITTLLILQMSHTVVAAINRGTFTLADWTIMPRRGVLASFLAAHPRLRGAVGRFVARRRVRRGFLVQDPGSRSVEPAVVLEMDDGEDGDGGEVVKEEPLTEHDLAGELTGAIKGVAHDLRARSPRRYTYDEWKRFVGLMRFSARCQENHDHGGCCGAEGVVGWDWIGEDSPLLANITEAEWVLDRLCESLDRYTRRQAMLAVSAVVFYCRCPYPDQRRVMS